MTAVAMQLSLLIAHCLAVSAYARGGGIKCACTTADCIATGIDLCRTETFCYSKLKRLSLQQEDTPVPLEKGCLTEANQDLCPVEAKPGVRLEFVVHLGGQLYVHCCSERWCNSLQLATLPALPSTTSAAAVASELDNQRPQRPRRPWPAEKPAEKPSNEAKKSISRPDSPLYPPDPQLSWKTLLTRPRPPSKTTLPPPMPTVAWRHRRPESPPPPPPLASKPLPAETAFADVDRVGDIGGVSVGIGSAGRTDIIHPVFIAVPVTSLCLILSALAALIVLVRRRDQLHYQAGEPLPPRDQRHLNRQQHLQPPQPHHQYHLDYRNSMLDCEAATAVLGPTAGLLGSADNGKHEKKYKQSSAHPLLLADYPDVTRHTGSAISSSPT